MLIFIVNNYLISRNLENELSNRKDSQRTSDRVMDKPYLIDYLETAENVHAGYDRKILEHTACCITACCI